MIVRGRELVFFESFVEDLENIEEFIRQYNKEKALKNTEEIWQFITEIVAEMPLGFPQKESQIFPQKSIRRAVFRKTYSIIYIVENRSIEFIRIFDNRQDPSENLF